MVEDTHTFASELLYRRQVRTDFRTWAMHRLRQIAGPDVQLAPFQLLICEKLQQVADGRVRNLFISLPPGGGKSTLVTKLFSPFWMPRHKGEEGNVCLATHTATLALAMSSEVQQAMEENASVLDATIDRDKTASEHWRLVSNQNFYAFSADQKPSGKRAGIKIFDDLVKGKAEADLKSERNRLWSWFETEFETRRVRDITPQIGVGTRWNVDDVYGRWIARQESLGDPVDVLEIPALCFDPKRDVLKRAVDESYWPERFSAAYLQQIRDGMRANRDWHALYQQDPQAEFGAFFEIGLIEQTVKMPARDALRVIGCTDYAVTGSEGNGRSDYTVLMCLGMDEDRNIHVLDMWRKQATADEWSEAMFEMNDRYNPEFWAEPGDMIQKAVDSFIERAYMEYKKRAVAFGRVARLFDRRQYSQHKSKEGRATTLRGLVSVGKVKIASQCRGSQDIMNEMRVFGTGAEHDDIVDAFALGCIALMGVQTPLSQAKRDARYDRRRIPDNWRIYG